MSRLGIDDISIHVPNLYISTLGEFASKRGIDPGKLSRGIGVEKMAVPDLHEDAATMAAMAVLDLLRRNDLDPKRIGKIYIGTESSVDEAKAIGTYVIGMLERVYGAGSFRHCSTVEFKSACIAASFALESVSYWLAQREDRIGIVVASDIARYDLKSPGEYTQGAGAVSLLLKHDPRILTFDMAFGTYTKDEDDFYRPFGMKTAVVNGKHSNVCYMNAMNGAFKNFEEMALSDGIVNLGPGECITDHLDHILFHIPYPRMVEYSASALFRQEWRDLPRFSKITESIGSEPKKGDFSDDDEYLKADAAFSKKFVSTSGFKEAFESKVAPSTLISRQVGNIYTGSMYLGLASLLEAGRLNPGDRVAFGSYGSGCSAMVFSGKVQKSVLKIKPLRVMERLSKRLEIGLDEYENLHSGAATTSIQSPKDEYALVGIDENGYRMYDYL